MRIIRPVRSDERRQELDKRILAERLINIFESQTRPVGQGAKARLREALLVELGRWKVQ